MYSERFVNGNNMLNEVDGRSGEKVNESLKSIAPD